MLERKSGSIVSAGLRVAVAAVALCALFPVRAHAYLDAGTGSVILQAVVATVAGAALAIKVYWHKLKTLVGRKSSKTDHSEPST